MKPRPHHPDADTQEVATLDTSFLPVLPQPLPEAALPAER